MTAPSIQVEYHADGFADARPAINVKLHSSAQAMTPPEFQGAYPAEGGAVTLRDPAEL